jgi:adenosylmethionine-8-amino-7-oxononanoate aminotransferase
MKAYSTDELRALDRRHVWHPFTHMKLWLEDQPLVITAAEGMELIDSDGNRYLDGVSSLWCNVHGHRVPEIDQAIRRQLDKVAHTTLLGLASEPAILLADRLMQLVPPGLTKVFYSDAGATATEIAFKLAVQYWHNVGRPRKTEFIGLAEAYHGDTTGAMSVGRTTAFHRPYFPLLFKVHFAPTPFVYRFNVDDAGAQLPLPLGERAGVRGHPAQEPETADNAAAARTPHPNPLPQGERGLQRDSARERAADAVAGAARTTPYPGPVSQREREPERVRDASLAAMERILAEHHETIAAVCVEPVVQGAAGMIVHPEGYLRGVRALCNKYNILLICDEVATGFGRTGRMFACEHEDVSPDLMCVAKGITGGYLPLAATFATQRIFDAFLGDPWEGKTFFHGHTYTGNPLACAAAQASLDLFEKHDLVTAVARKAEALAKLLDGLRHLPHVGDIRQKGFMVGIELVEDRATKKPFDPKKRIGAAVCAAVRRHGVIIRPLADVLVLMPPLAMELHDLRRIVEAIGHEVRTL